MNDIASPPEEKPSPRSDEPAPASPSANLPWRWPAFPLNAILALLIVYTLYFGRDILVPITIALMLDLLLSPLVMKLKRFRFPEPLSAALLVVAVVGSLGWGVYALSSPAADWMHKAPESLAQIERKVSVFKKPVQEVSKATKEVEHLAQVEPPGTAAPKVAVNQRSLTERLISGTGLVAAQVLVVIVLLYFLLASGDIFMRRLIRALSRRRDRRRAVEIVRAIRRDISVYLGTVTIINAGLGTATAIGMALIGMPNPALWGVVAAILNFIPYVGALTTTVILTAIGLLSFDELGHSLLAPIVFQVLANIESNLVTPYLIGRNLTINPALVVLALVVWGWMWGVPGALLAVPFLVLLKIFADHIDSLEGISVFLGRRDPP